jgi:hypothetical protein
VGHPAATNCPNASEAEKIALLHQTIFEIRACQDETLGTLPFDVTHYCPLLCVSYSFTMGGQGKNKHHEKERGGGCGGRDRAGNFKALVTAITSSRSHDNQSHECCRRNGLAAALMNAESHPRKRRRNEHEKNDRCSRGNTGGRNRRWLRRERSACEISLCRREVII